MHYSDRPEMVRVDRFKPGGKWYDTFALDMEAHWDDTVDGHYVTVADRVKAALADAGIDVDTSIFNYVVLDPYTKDGYPVMIPGGG